MKLTPTQLSHLIASEVHVVIGAFLLYLCSFYFPGNLLAVAIAYAGLFAFELWKEFWLDLRTEEGATVSWGVFDLGMYYAGAGLAWLGLFLTHKPL